MIGRTFKNTICWPWPLLTDGICSFVTILCLYAASLQKMTPLIDTFSLLLTTIVSVQNLPNKYYCTFSGNVPRNTRDVLYHRVENSSFNACFLVFFLSQLLSA